jgi:UDPglucose 6-dehydrogenase
MQNKTIGFIGQGWIGKNYADDFENRGFEVVRYALEEPYKNNLEKLQACQLIFVAVPTPTTEGKFDDSIVRAAVKHAPSGATVVIKSTIVPGTTEAVQKENPEIFVMHSPEFLREKTAAHDAAHPERNIIGIPVQNEAYRIKAQEALDVLPKAQFEQICTAREAELIKYAGNCFLYAKVVYINLIYDMAQKLGCDWEKIKEAFAADPRLGKSHLNPVDKSGHLGKDGNGGRGAGGHCFIKDYAALVESYGKWVGDEPGIQMLESIKEKNLHLLSESGKDTDLIDLVYGKK